MGQDHRVALREKDFRVAKLSGWGRKVLTGGIKQAGRRDHGDQLGETGRGKFRQMCHCGPARHHNTVELRGGHMLVRSDFRLDRNTRERKFARMDVFLNAFQFS